MGMTIPLLCSDAFVSGSPWPSRHFGITALPCLFCPCLLPVSDSYAHVLSLLSDMPEYAWLVANFLGVVLLLSPLVQHTQRRDSSTLALLAWVWILCLLQADRKHHSDRIAVFMIRKISVIMEREET
jgi:hypothetical protein